MKLLSIFLAFSNILLSFGIKEDAPDPISLEWWQKDFHTVSADDGVPQFKSQCSLSPELKNEIRSYKDTVNRIVETSLTGEFRGKTFEDLAVFVDHFGSRLSGSASLEYAITYLGSLMKNSGLSNVHEENATIPRWIRGKESADLILPRYKPLSIKGLGFSVPTPPEGIVAEVIVIRSFKDLILAQDIIKGKIVLYNSDSGEAKIHVLMGAAMAARAGAVASLARSMTTYSLNTPHTGAQYYDDKYPKIPTAALTLEDADMITRMSDRGEKVTIHLRMANLENTETVSRNVIGDYVGREIKDEFVIVAGHSDSWDVGQGAVDDGVGPLLSIELTRVLQYLNLRPRRTLRNIYFTAEEPGLFGVRQYVKDHKDDMDRYSAAIEADYGCLKAAGLIFTGTPEVGCIMQEILGLLKTTNATSVVQSSGLSTDILAMTMTGVPGVILNGDDGRYFWYHHTEADTMTALRQNDLDNCLAVWASTAYIIADLKEKLPR